MQVPLGGMPRMPLMALLTSVSSPCAIRAVQSAATPSFGAPAAPVP